MKAPDQDRDEFIRALTQRLDAGAQAYGDCSFSRSPDALLVELEQEALDLAGWGYILWSRIQRARAAAAALSRCHGCGGYQNQCICGLVT
jgi:hypothetical protein